GAHATPIAAAPADGLRQNAERVVGRIRGRVDAGTVVVHAGGNVGIAQRDDCRVAAAAPATSAAQRQRGIEAHGRVGVAGIPAIAAPAADRLRHHADGVRAAGTDVQAVVVGLYRRRLTSGTAAATHHQGGDRREADVLDGAPITAA